MKALGLAVLIILNLPLFGLLCAIFFKGEDIGEMVRFLFLPDILSLCRGEYIEDKWVEAKFLIFSLVCSLTIWSEIELIEKRFPAVTAYFTS